MTKIEKKYTIDFQTSGNNTEILHQGRIATEEIRKFGIKRLPNYFIDTFEITNIVVDGSISLKEGEDIVYIKSKDRIGYTLNELHIIEYDQPYEIIFNRKAIVDYNNFEYNLSNITFSLSSKGEGDNSLTEKIKFELELNFIKEISTPELTFTLEDDFDFGKEYINSDKVKCGNLEIELKSSIAYASEISQLGAKCYLKEIMYSDIVSFGEPNEISETNPWTDDIGITSDVSLGSKLMKQKNDGIINLANITPNNTIKIPVYIDLSKYSVPREKQTEELIININYSADGKSFSEEVKSDLVIIPNTTQTSLLWECTDGGENKVLNGSYDFDQASSWIKGDNGSMECFSLLVGNMASESNNGGKVEISDFKIKLKYDDDRDYSTIDIIGSEGKYKDSSLSIFTINGRSTNLVSDNFTFEDGTQPEELILEFNDADIIEIPQGIAKLNMNVSFSYSITDSSGEESNGTKESCIKFRIFKDTGDHWIALDFGTSASVAAFADSEEIETKNIDSLIINLQNSLENIVGDENYNVNDIKESSSKFISSEVMLRRDSDAIYPKAHLNGTKFRNNLIELSPTNSRLTANKTGLPYLKSIIGAEQIPNPNNQFDNYKYRIDIDGKLQEFTEKPLMLSDVLSTTYRSLISDFVLPTIKDTEKANKVIFTIPNTFTPKHTRLIRDVVESSTNQFNKHYISFVSESDAVLSYYLKQWGTINSNRSNIDNYTSSDEYVFIYDMGAGTLDLTYAKISRDNNQNTNVEIIGRLGTTTAGNYFDAVIANAIQKLDTNNFFEISDFMDTNSLNASELDVLADLKTAIRENIKPNLNNSEVTIYANREVNGKFTFSETPINAFDDEAGFEIKIIDILNSKEVKDFIEKNSKTLIKEFFDLYSDPERIGSDLVKGQFEIDTVMFTGRSIQFDNLRKEVKMELEDWSKADDDVHIIFNKDSKNLKSIVVKGALQYATSYRDRVGNSTQINNRNVQARYGILTKNNLGKWIFDEFINPTTQPSSVNSHFKDGITIYKYDTNEHSEHFSNKITLSHSPIAFFVQSYSSDTARDVENNNWEFITKMFNINRGSIGTKNFNDVPVRVQINEDNSMLVKVGNKRFGEKEPLSINTDNNETFRMSMWPYM